MASYTRYFAEAASADVFTLMSRKAAVLTFPKQEEITQLIHEALDKELAKFSMRLIHTGDLAELEANQKAQRKPRAKGSRDA